MNSLLPWLWAAFALLVWPSLALASEGTEVVVVLDNSCSMDSTYSWNRKPRQPTDPERRAILAGLILEGWIRRSDDRITIVPMHGDDITAGQADRLAGLKHFRATPFQQPLMHARALLENSDKTDRLLVMVTDGMPTDYDNPSAGVALLEPGRHPMPFDVVALAVLPADADADLVTGALGFLEPVVGDAGEVIRVQQARDLVPAMTESWAQVLGSKPVSGTLGAGQTKTVHVGRYVTEVLVVASANAPSGPFVARLTASDGERAADTQGSTACGHCRSPATHFQTWRLPHDPETETDLTLAYDRGRSDVTYGFILRYDLDARLELEPSAIAGGASTVRAWLSWRGTRVEDDRFFSEDGFSATLDVDGQSLPMKHVGEGWFEAQLPVPSDRAGAELAMGLTLKNTWLETSTSGRLKIIAPPTLDLRADALDLGTWSGERGKTMRCGEVKLIGDRPEGIPIAPRFEGVPDGIVMDATPIDGDDTRWNVCAHAQGCCGDAVATEQTAVYFAVDNPAVLGDPARAGVRFTVEATHWWTCWWPWIVGLLAALLLFLIILGFLRGHDFDPDATVRIASSERQLPRASAVVLREQPKGRRGFYRDARICLTASGEFVSSPSKAALHVQAVRGGSRFHLRGPLERQDRRTRKFVPLTEDEARDGPTSGVLYRCGELVLRFE